MGRIKAGKLSGAAFRQQLLVVLTLLVFGATALRAQAAEALTVVASIRPLALLVDEVAGDAAEVRVLVPGNASPHTYSMKVSDRRKLEDADLLVWLGPEFERFLDDVARQRNAEAVLALGELPKLSWPNARPESATQPSNDHHGHDHAARDMHLWLNPENARLFLRAITEKLGQLQPEKAPLFAQNLAQAEQRLTTATEALRQALEPVAERGFGVSHDAFSHFVEYFNLNQLAAVSALPDQGLSAKHLRQTQQQLQGAHCLLVDSSEPAPASHKLQRLFDIPVVRVDPLAQDPVIDSYQELLTELGRQFRECLE